MTNNSDRQTDEDQAFLAGARRLRNILTHPFAIGFLAIAAAAAIFRMGIIVGEVAYLAFDGEGMMATAFAGTLITVLLAIIAIGVWLDRRQGTRDTITAPLTGTERERLRSYVQPASPLVRWYQPLAVAVFIVLAAPGVLLLGTPWDGLWVLAVLIANPLARWLRAQGHLLTTRDLGFPVPGLSPWPSIAIAESGAPDHVRRVRATTVLEHGRAAFDRDGAPDPDHASSLQVPRLGPQRAPWRPALTHTPNIEPGAGCLMARAPTWGVPTNGDGGRGGGSPTRQRRR